MTPKSASSAPSVQSGNLQIHSLGRRIGSRAATVVAVALAGVGLLMSSAAFGQDPGGSPAGKKMKNPVAASAESVAAGKASYQKYCQFCHGPEAKGDGKMAPKGTHPADLTDAKWDRGSTDGEIFLVIQNGAGPKFEMKGYKGKMPDPDMWNIVNYLRSIGPKSK